MGAIYLLYRLVNLKENGKERNASKCFLTQPLLEAVKVSLKKGSQTVLFLNGEDLTLSPNAVNVGIYSGVLIAM